MSIVYDVRQYVGIGKIPTTQLPNDTFVVKDWNSHQLLHSSVNTSTWFVTMWNEDHCYLQCSGSWVECASYFEMATDHKVYEQDAPFKWGVPIENPTGATTYTPYWTDDETGEEFEDEDGWRYKQYKTNYHLLVSTKSFDIHDDNPDQDIKDHNNVVRFESYAYDNLIDLVKDIETYTHIAF